MFCLNFAWNSDTLLNMVDCASDSTIEIISLSIVLVIWKNIKKMQNFFATKGANNQ